MGDLTILCVIESEMNHFWDDWCWLLWILIGVGAVVDPTSVLVGGWSQLFLKGRSHGSRSRPPQVAACGLLVSLVVLLAARGEFQLQPHHPPPSHHPPATRVLCIAPS